MCGHALIGLGSNLGNRKLILDEAVKSLSLLGKLDAVSSYHETAPVGGPTGQGPFLNAAVQLLTSIDSTTLHRELHQIEAHSGRVRRVRWGERTLDLDLLLRGDEMINDSDLTLPHPRFAVRRFVLSPLSEIAPRAIDPLTGRTIQQLLQNLDRRPSRVALLAQDVRFLRQVAERVSEGLEEMESLSPSFMTSQRSNPSADFVLGDSEAPRDWLVRSLPLSASDPDGDLTAFSLESFANDAGPFTFAVALNPGGEWRTGTRHAPCAIPLLLVQSRDPEEAATEVLASCAATRIG